MIEHLRLRKQLYDFAQGDLEQPLREKVERHLSSCRKCADEVKYLRTILQMKEGALVQPSERLSPEYWNHFALNVEPRIREAQHRKNYSSVSVTEWVRTLFVFQKKYIAALGGGLALGVLIELYVLPWRQNVKEQLADGSVVQSTQAVVPADLVADRMHQYFRKSKVLLVGISNMKDDDDVDLSVERKASRELLHEARYLKTQDLDSRSKKLINDLDKILIELADMEESNDLPNVEILRGGIHQKNLLFKIRMAESFYDSTKLTSNNNNER